MSHSIKTDNNLWISNSDASGTIEIRKKHLAKDEKFAEWDTLFVKLELSDIKQYLDYCGYKITEK